MIDLSLLCMRVGMVDLQTERFGFGSAETVWDCWTTLAMPKASTSKEESTVTKLEAVIQPRKLDAVKTALLELGIEGMTISDVRGHGRQKGHTEHYRGGEYTVDLLPKVKLEIVLPDDRVDDTVNTILKNAATGQIGDGKIFLYKVEEAIRIRNQERGHAAL
jgi:nitrogen regulatory protein P-II 1